MHNAVKNTGLTGRRWFDAKADCRSFVVRPVALLQIWARGTPASFGIGSGISTVLRDKCWLSSWPDKLQKTISKITWAIRQRPWLSFGDTYKDICFPVDKYFYMCYCDIAGRKVHEKLFIKGSYSDTESGWMVWSGRDREPPPVQAPNQKRTDNCKTSGQGRPPQNTWQYRTAVGA